MNKTNSDLFSEAVLDELYHINIHQSDKNYSSDSHSDDENLKTVSIKDEPVDKEKEEIESAENKLNELLSNHVIIDENIIYDLSDSDDECSIVQVSSADTGEELEPELKAYVYHHLSIKTEVSDDINEDHTPGCSTNNEDFGKDIYKETIKQEPDLDIEDYSCSDVENYPMDETNSASVVDTVPIPIQNQIKIEDKNDEDVISLEPNIVIDVAENDLHTNEYSEDTVIEENEESLMPDSEVDLSIYKQPQNNLISFYRQINGLKKAPTFLTQEECFEFFSKILQIKANHLTLKNDIESDNLIKFDQLAIWGRNMNRNVEDLMKEVVPVGYTADEAKKFVVMMINSKNTNKQQSADTNEENIHLSKYKYFCLACDRRDDNLTWLVAHLCRDTSEMIYMCCFCGFIFFNNYCSLLYHVILDKLDGPKDRYCVECNGFYPSLVNHLMDTKGSWRQCCKNCDFISLSQCSYLIHVRYHEMKRHYLCPECGAYFIFFEHLERHIKNVCFFEAKKTRYICPICAIIFNDKVYFQQHFLSFHHQRLLKCIECHSVFLNRFQYVDHRAKEHPESPCTYQIFHTCELCPGYEYKSSIIQAHMRMHSNHPIHAVILYICECNYYTIHKQKFIDHKKGRCMETPSYGKWEKAHIMKICNECQDVKFVNISQPFVCEYCEVQKNPGLPKLYLCKSCKFLISYSWDSVIQHFFSYHPTVTEYNYASDVVAISIPSNASWVQTTPNKFVPIKPKPIKKQTRTLLSGGTITPLYVVCENSTPISQAQGFENSKNLRKLRFIPKLQSIKGRQIKQPPKKKSKNDETKFYNSLSHFMAEGSGSSYNSEKKKTHKSNTVIKKSSMSLNQHCIIDESLKRLKEDTFPVGPFSANTNVESSNVLQVNNTLSGHHSSCIASTVKHQTFQNISARTEKGEQTFQISAGDLKCSENGFSKKKKTHLSRLQPNVNVCSQSTTTDSFSEVVEVKNMEVISFNKQCKETMSDHDLEHTTTNSAEIHKQNNNKMNVTAMETCLDCKKCDFKCNEAVQLVRHFINVHHVQNTYQCMECGDCFGNIKKKMNHLRSVHKINTKCYLEPDVNRLDTCKSKFRCPVCLIGFPNDQEKNLHMRCHGMAYLQLLKSNSKEI